MQNPAVSTSMLLKNYSFELSGEKPEQVADNWLSLYPSKWVMAAVVEAIYQGRYKANSVNRILESWCLRGHPNHHFDYTFACIVCSQLLDNANQATGLPEELPAPAPAAAIASQVAQPVSVAQPIPMDTTNGLTPPGTPLLQSFYPSQSGSIGQNYPNVGIQKWARLPIRLSSHCG